MDNNFLIYNQMSSFSSLTYNILKRLIDSESEGAEVIFKLLFYNTSDAVSKPNLTKNQKIGLIYSGQEDSSPFRIFRTPHTDDAFVMAVSKLHIFPFTVAPINRSLASIGIMIQVICHNKISILSDSTARLDLLIATLVQELNGAEINGVGKLSFEAGSAADMRNDYIKQDIYPNKSYSGYSMIMTTRDA